MNLAEKIRSMSDEELVTAACLAMGCVATSCDSKDEFETLRPVIDGIAQMMKDGFTELLTEMPWEKAVWELLESMIGKS